MFQFKQPDYQCKILENANTFLRDGHIGIKLYSVYFAPNGTLMKTYTVHNFFYVLLSSHVMSTIKSPSVSQVLVHYLPCHTSLMRFIIQVANTVQCKDSLSEVDCSSSRTSLFLTKCMTFKKRQQINTTCTICSNEVEMVIKNNV